MKTSTKIGIGFSVATIAGVYAAVTFSEKIMEKIEHETTRYKTKKIVNDKFGGNEKLLNIVEDLSDKELDSISLVAKEIKENRNKISSLGEKVKNNTEKLLDR